LPFISKKRKKGILNQEEWDKLMTAVRCFMKQYADNILAGHFPLEPKKCPKDDQFSSFCNFISICPWEEGE